jgi:hypothetical protein
MACSGSSTFVLDAGLKKVTQGVYHLAYFGGADRDHRARELDVRLD